MSTPVYPRSSTYRLNQRKRLISRPSVLDHTHGNRAVFFQDLRQQQFAIAKSQASNFSKLKSRDCLKPRKFSWEDDQ